MIKVDSVKFAPNAFLAWYIKWYFTKAHINGKLTKKLNQLLALGGMVMEMVSIWLSTLPGRDAGLFVLPSKVRKNKKGAPLGTDLGLGSADLVTVDQARERALEYRHMAQLGLNPRYNVQLKASTFQEIAQQVHIKRLPTWKNTKHGQQ